MSRLYARTQNYWNSLLINGFLVNLVLFFASAWVLENYYHVAVIERMSFSASDPTWMPPPQVSKPILGVHHFGDYQIMTGYAKDPNPYSEKLVLPAQYLPFTFILTRFFDVFGLRGGFFVYSALVVICLLYTCISLLRFASTHEKILFLSLILLLSQPFVTAMDRGNLQGLMTGLVGVAYVQWKRGKSRSAFVFFLLACLLKGYPILLLLFMKRKAIRNFITLSLATLAVSLISLPILRIGILEGVSGYLHGIRQNQTSCLTCGYSLSSLVNKVLILVTPSMRQSHSLISLDTLLILGWLGFCLWIVHKFILPDWAVVFVALSSLQILPGLANNFTLLWAVIAAAIFYDSHSRHAEDQDASNYENLLITRILVVLSFWVTLGPNCWLLHGPHNYATWLTSVLSPAFILLSIGSIPVLAKKIGRGARARNGIHIRK